MSTPATFPASLADLTVRPAPSQMSLPTRSPTAGSETSSVRHSQTIPAPFAVLTIPRSGTCRLRQLGEFLAE